MPQVTLRAMTTDEYARWQPGAVADYAAAHAEAGSMPADQARQLADQQFRDLLPDGITTPGHHLLVPEVDAVPVGLLWLHVPSEERSPAAFVYDVEVAPGMRGRGLGRAIMLAAETYARDRGAASMRLHVFGGNAVARHLYESLGYEATNVVMRKILDASEG